MLPKLPEHPKLGSCTLFVEIDRQVIGDEWERRNPMQVLGSACQKNPLFLAAGAVLQGLTAGAAVGFRVFRGAGGLNSALRAGSGGLRRHRRTGVRSRLARGGDHRVFRALSGGAFSAPLRFPAQQKADAVDVEGED